MAATWRRPPVVGPTHGNFGLIALLLLLLLLLSLLTLSAGSAHSPVLSAVPTTIASTAQHPLAAPFFFTAETRILRRETETSSGLLRRLGRRRQWRWMARNRLPPGPPQLPPGPPQLPVVGNALDIIRNGGLRETLIRYSERFGPVSVARNTLAELVMVNDPEVTREVLISQTATFKDRLAPGRNVTLGAAGVVTAPSELHKVFRSLLNPFFFNKRLLENYTRTVEGKAAAIASAWSTGRVVDLQPVFKTMALDVISRIAFTDLDTGGERTADTIRRYLDSSARLTQQRQVSNVVKKLAEPIDQFLEQVQLPILPQRLPRIGDLAEPEELDTFLALQKEMLALERTLIKARRHERRLGNIEAEARAEAEPEAKPEASGEHAASDILDVLLDNHTIRMTDDQILTVIQEILIAGSDTTASSITATLYLIGKNLRVQKNVLRELDAVFGNGVPIAYDDLERLPYLNACIKEAMRMYPAVDLIIRHSGKDAIVKGLQGEYLIPKSSVVLISPYALGRDTAQWGDDVDKFRPERFLELQASSKGSKPRYPKHSCAWLPFGGGPHGCLGGKLAMMESMVTCATVLRQWALKAPLDADLKPRWGVTIDFDGGVPIRPIPRAAMR